MNSNDRAHRQGSCRAITQKSGSDKPHRLIRSRRNTLASIPNAVACKASICMELSVFSLNVVLLNEVYYYESTCPAIVLS